jgi:predicted permease
MLHDLRLALRTLRRSPLFAASATLALALGIGANTAVFSVVHAVLLAPLPYPEPDRLLALSELNRIEGRDDGRVSRGTFVDWAARARTIESLAAYSSGGESLWTIGERLEVVRVAAVSPSLVRVLGFAPVAGRWFDESSTPPAVPPVVISFGLWQRAFGGAADVIGRTVLVEGRTRREIIGVLPQDFSFPEDADAWVSLNLTGPVAPQQRRFLYYHAIARSAEGTTIDDVRREFEALSAQLAAEIPASNAAWTARVIPLAGSDVDSHKPALLTLTAAVGGVLLIGCVNVANLLLARASARQRDLAVRIALGAGIGRLARQAIAEAAVLSAFGTLLGIILGHWISGVLVRMAPPDVPRLANVGMNMALLLFAGAAGLATAAFIAVAPVLQATRAGRRVVPHANVRAATPRAALIRRILIGAEVATVVVLLTAALLLLRTFVSLRQVDLGFQADTLYRVSARWPLGRMAPTTPGARPWPRLQRAVDGLVDAVAAIPGVDAAGLISEVPLTSAPYSGTVWRSDAPGAAGLTPPTDPRDRWRADLSIVTPGYFSALEVPVLRGRNFTDADRLTDAELNATNAPPPGVAIVNDALAARYFPGENPVGRTLVLYDDQTFGWSRTIVGVVADVRSHTVADPAGPAVFIPHAQHPDIFLPSLVVRSSLPADVFSTAVRDRIAAYDAQLLVQRVQPMTEVVSGALSRPRFNLLLVGSVAALGLVLAAIGIYGVVSFLVTQRTREIGIRMALGAQRPDVMRLVLREAMSPVAIGAAIGLVAATAVANAIASLLFGVRPLDPSSLLAAPLLLTAAALLASYLPARRATRVDALVALREE